MINKHSVTSPINLNEGLHSKLFVIQVTGNLKAESCKDAANKRNRLGNQGIPLGDELKSNFGCYMDDNQNRVLVMLHCRGNQLIDMLKVENILKSEFHRIDAKELEEEFDLAYGIINPLISIQNQNILQIFDKTVLESYQPPYTMMTNAGSFELGLEFYPQELINSLPNTIVADITQDDQRPQITVHKIGILTGNSPESGLMLWETMNTKIREKLGHHFKGDISFPEVVIESEPAMGLSMELEEREEETRKTVVRGIENLCQRGATLVAIACNTTQYFRHEIENVCKRYNVTYIPMAEAVLQHLSKERIDEFDFLGIKYVADFEKWSDFKLLDKSKSVRIPNSTDLKEINRLAFEVKRNKITGKGINKLRDLINNATQTNHIVIALTELSILLSNQHKQKKSQKVYIDTLSLLADALAATFVEGIWDMYHFPSKKKSIKATRK